MSNGVAFESIKWFILYFAVIMAWMWNTKKLYARDYVTSICAAFLTPFVMQLIYGAIPLYLHSTSNDLLIMIMLYFILHMVCNTIRRAVRSMQKSHSTF